jgi:hypothetical protein
MIMLMKFYPEETYTIVRVGRQLCDTLRTKNGLRQGDDLSSLLSNFVLEYPIIRVKVNQDELKLNGTFRLIICADGVTIGQKRRYYKEKSSNFSSC